VGANVSLVRDVRCYTELPSRGREGEALSVLRSVFSVNTGQGRARYPVPGLRTDRLSPHILAAPTTWAAALRDSLQKAGQLASPSLATTTAIMLIINFSIQFGYYGLWLWFPELFNKLERFHHQQPNKTLSVCEVINIPLPALESNLTTASCSASVPDDQVFINSFIISLSAAPANIWTIFHMDKLGRRFFLCFSMLLSGSSAFLIYFVDSAGMNLVLSCIFGAVSTMGFNSLDCLGIELFPTSVRSTAMAVTLVAARLGAISGNLAFGYLVESHCAVPILTVAALLVSGGLFGLLLPNTTKKPLA